jgi:uncharacterized protein (UPF0332 family)
VNEYELIIAKAENKIKTADFNFSAGQYDDAVSRAYYAVFHALTACLLSKGLSFSSHSQVIGAFNREFIKSGTFPKAFSKDIQILFDDRQSGDYDILTPIDEQMAATDIKRAKTIVDSIKQHLKI